MCEKRKGSFFSIAAFFLMIALCFSTKYTVEAAGEEKGLMMIHQTEGGTVSSNVSRNNYGSYHAYVVNSYLNKDSDAGYTRVEYVNNTVVIEKYDKDYTFKSRKEIANPLQRFGGYYCGSNYNFLVFGQDNLQENDSVETIRVVKYDKNWNELDSVSEKANNTYIPFDAGSLRMTENEGWLYIHTCHEMYDDGDGFHHQANMSYIINQANMAILDSYFDIYDITKGYVSHSFNQFIVTDGNYIYRLDHGDAHKRALQITRIQHGYRVSSVSSKYTLPLVIQGATGANATGVSVGGFESCGSLLVAAGNSVPQDDPSTYSASATRNIFITSTNNNFTNSSASTTMKWITNYSSNDKITVRTPQLIKVNDNKLYLLWEEVDGNTSAISTKIATIDASGNLLKEAVTLNARLSDCQPILNDQGNLVWYQTSSRSPVFYEMDPEHAEDYVIQGEIDLNDCMITLDQDTYKYASSFYRPVPTITYGDYKLIENTDYVVSYSNNYYPADSSMEKYPTVTIKGKGIFENQVDKTFTILPIDLEKEGYSLKLNVDTYSYNGEYYFINLSGNIRIYKGDAEASVNGTIIGDTGATNAGTYKVILAGIENEGYTGTISAEWKILPTEITEENVIFTIGSTSLEYNGSGRKPMVDFRRKDNRSISSSDYLISYENNVEVGTATVKVTGRNNYTGSLTRTFEITPYDLTKSTTNATLNPGSMEYTGEGLEPDVVVVMGPYSYSPVLNPENYDLEYSNNIIPGTGVVKITGKKNCIGTITKYFNVIQRIPYLKVGDTIYKDDMFVNLTLTYLDEIPLSTDVDAGFKCTIGKRDYLSIDDNNVLHADKVTTSSVNVSVSIAAGTYSKSQSYYLFCKVSPKEITEDMITLEDSQVEYNGQEQRPVPVLRYKNQTLEEGRDYSLSYSENVNAGKATLIITGKGNYAGTITKDFEIAPCDLSKCEVVLDKNEFAYNGSAFEPKATVYLDKARGTVLAADNYTISYSENVDPGTAVATLTANSENCVGSKSVNFSILKGEANIHLESSTITIGEMTVAILEEDKGFMEVSSKDSEIAYMFMISKIVGKHAGKTTIHVKYDGRGYYNDKELDLELEVLPVNLESDKIKVTLDNDSYVYDGTAKTPEVKVTYDGKNLQKNIDYEVNYKNNVNAGNKADVQAAPTVQIKGIHDYKGSITTTFTILPKSAEDAEVILSKDEYIYSGSKYEPEVTVRSGKEELLPGSDYEVEYLNNINADGEDAVPTVKVITKGNYSGTLTKTFKILPYDLANATVKLSETDYVYDGTEHCPDVKLYRDAEEKNEIVPHAYQVTYDNNVKAGTAKVQISSADPNYTGQNSATYTIDKATPSYSVDKTAIGIGESANVMLAEGEVKPTLTSADTEILTAEGNEYRGLHAGTGKIHVTIAESEDYKALEETVEIEVLPYELCEETASLTLKTDTFVYDGTEKEPEVTVTYEGAELIADKDYTIHYSENVNAGEATVTENVPTVTVKGIGDYKGIMTIPFVIQKAETTASLSKNAILLGEFTEMLLSDHGDGKVTYKVENPSVVTINQDGKIVAVGVGITKITVIYAGDANHNQSSETYEITVKDTPAATRTPEEQQSINDIQNILGVTEKEAAEITAVTKAYGVSKDTIKINDSLLLNRKNDSDLPGSSFMLLKANIAKAGKTNLKVKWSRVSGADGYILYGSKCGKNNVLKKLKTLGSASTSFNDARLTKGTYYKYLVIAYKQVGNVQVTIASSPYIHGVTKGGKYGMAKAVKITKIGKNKKKVNAVTLAKGKKARIYSVEVKQDKTIKKHRKICYQSSDPTIAKVASNGTVTALKKGKCTIYVYAQNGKYKTVKVTVK